jgi:hypothetical protein
MIQDERWMAKIIDITMISIKISILFVYLNIIRYSRGGMCCIDLVKANLFCNLRILFRTFENFV